MLVRKERANGMMIGEKGFSVQGDMLQVGDAAPNFKLTATNWSIKSLEDYEGKIKVLSIVPSLDTSVCSAQTHRFNDEAGKLGEDVVVLSISADLPYAQKRWCGTEGVDHVEALSTHKDMQFSDDYGVHVADLRINQRAVFVVDKNNHIVHAEYVPIIGEEVDFDAALQAVKTAKDS
jgi:thiol peroxidase